MSRNACIAFLFGLASTGIMPVGDAEAKARPAIESHVINQICSGRTIEFKNVHWGIPEHRAQFHASASHTARMTAKDCQNLMAGKSLYDVNIDLHNMARDWRDGVLYSHHNYEKLFIDVWRIYQEAAAVNPSIQAVRVNSSTRSKHTHYNVLGHKTDSQHVSGTTLDFGIEGLNVSKTYCVAHAYRQAVYNGNGGLGYYPANESDMIHYDLRSSQANWGPVPSCKGRNKIKFDMSGSMVAALKNKPDVGVAPHTLIATNIPKDVPIPTRRPDYPVDVAQIYVSPERFGAMPLTPDERIANAWQGSSIAYLPMIIQQEGEPFISAEPSSNLGILSYSSNDTGDMADVQLSKTSRVLKGRVRKASYAP